MEEVKKDIPEMPKPTVLQLGVQQGQINYNGEIKDVWITAANGKQLVFDKKEDAITAAQTELDAFKA